MLFAQLRCSGKLSFACTRRLIASASDDSNVKCTVQPIIGTHPHHLPWKLTGNCLGINPNRTPRRAVHR